jgi:transposase
MERKKQLTSPVKSLIINAVNLGKTQRQIAQEFNIPKSTIGNVVIKYKKRGHFHAIKRKPKAKILSERVEKLIVRESKANPRKTATALWLQFTNSHQIKCSASTVRRVLCRNNLFGRRPVKKPFISAKNRIARVKFAKDHLNWNEKQWEKVLFSDESKFNLFGSDGVKYVRRPINHRNDPKYQLPTVKHGGGNIMVWGAFSRDGVGPIHRIEGIMTGAIYKDLLQGVMLPHAKNKMPRGWIFQQDNDPKHTSSVVKNFMNQKKMRLLPWPSQSPDLNPIENLWEHVERQLAGQRPSNKDKLFEKIKEIWMNIPLDVLIKLIDSMPRRCQAVIDSKGFATKY